MFRLSGYVRCSMHKPPVGPISVSPSMYIKSVLGECFPLQSLPLTVSAGMTSLCVLCHLLSFSEHWASLPTSSTAHSGAITGLLLSYEQFWNNVSLAWCIVHLDLCKIFPCFLFAHEAYAIISSSRSSLLPARPARIPLLPHWFPSSCASFSHFWFTVLETGRWTERSADCTHISPSGARCRTPPAYLCPVKTPLKWKVQEVRWWGWNGAVKSAADPGLSKHVSAQGKYPQPYFNFNSSLAAAFWGHHWGERGLAIFPAPVLTLGIGLARLYFGFRTTPRAGWPPCQMPADLPARCWLVTTCNTQAFCYCCPSPPARSTHHLPFPPLHLANLFQALFQVEHLLILRPACTCTWTHALMHCFFSSPNIHLQTTWVWRETLPCYAKCTLPIYFLICHFLCCCELHQAPAISTGSHLQENVASHLHRDRDRDGDRDRDSMAAVPKVSIESLHPHLLLQICSTGQDMGRSHSRGF